MLDALNHIGRTSEALWKSWPGRPVWAPTLTQWAHTLIKLKKITGAAWIRKCLPLCISGELLMRWSWVAEGAVLPYSQVILMWTKAKQGLDLCHILTTAKWLQTGSAEAGINQVAVVAAFLSFVSCLTPPTLWGLKPGHSWVLTLESSILPQWICLMSFQY